MNGTPEKNTTPVMVNGEEVLLHIDRSLAPLTTLAELIQSGGDPDEDTGLRDLVFLCVKQVEINLHDGMIDLMRCERAAGLRGGGCHE